MADRQIRKILQKYLLGNAPTHEKNAVDQWYDAFDDEVVMSKEEAAATSEEIWANIVPVIAEQPPQRRIFSLPGYLKAAAMIAVVAGAGILYYRLTSSTPAPVLSYTTYITGTGEHKKITIQDGSQITLNAGTTVRVKDDVTKDRDIEIVDGEAFFEVHTDPARPFRVRTGTLTTTVLGTSFNVSAYKDLSHLTIGVVSGKVGIGNDTVPMHVISKEEELVFNKADGAFRTQPLDESVLAWQQGRLVFNDASFDEMAALMKKNYGIDIATNDKDIRNTRYTTELPTSMRPLQAAQVLAAIHSLKVREKNNKIYLAK